MSIDKCERAGMATLGSVQMATGILCCLSSVCLGPVSIPCTCCLGEMVIKAGADCIKAGQKNMMKACCDAEPQSQQMEDDPPAYTALN